MKTMKLRVFLTVLLSALTFAVITAGCETPAPDAEASPAAEASAAAPAAP